MNPTPSLHDFEDLPSLDLADSPALREFGELCKRVAAHAYQWRIEDQGLILARLIVIAGYHMGRDTDALWDEVVRRHSELLASMEPAEALH